MGQLVNHHPTSEQGDLFFRSLLNYWEKKSCDNSGPISIDLKICDYHLRLNFAAHALVNPLTRAFQHCSRPSPHSRPDFTIHALSGNPTELLQNSPWQKVDLEQPRGEIRPLLGDDIISSLVGTDLINVFHRRLQQAIYCLREDCPIPHHELAAPFRPLLHWWLREKNWYLVHGAGLGDEIERGVLLIGKSGSGKSTLSLASSLEGKLQFCGDDYCAVKVTPPYQLAPVFTCAKLTDETRRMLHLPPSKLFIKRSHKHLYFPDDGLNLRIPEKLALKALILPSLAPVGSHPELISLTSAQTAIELSVSSLYQLPHAGENEFSGLAKLARTIPGWLLKVPKHNPVSTIPFLKRIIDGS